MKALRPHWWLVNIDSGTGTWTNFDQVLSHHIVSLGCNKLQLILLSSPNPKYQLFVLSFFSVVVCLRFLCHHMTLVSYTSWESGVLFVLLLCNFMMCANNWTHMASWPYLFVCTLHNLIIIIILTYLVVFNFLNTCQVHSAMCVSKKKSILSIILCWSISYMSYYMLLNVK